MKLPSHIALTIEHNPHAANYQTAAEWLEHHLYFDEIAKIPRDESVTPEDRAAILASGEVWKISWHPDTPVGSCSVVAATLERALELANTP